MIRRVRLHNYMSHAETVIEPATGLTVLVGPNNCGKSAIVSALETLCNNTAGGYMVRHDENEASVTVETDDGHVIVWRRKGSTVSYVIDGREIHRVHRTVPDELHALLRLPKVETGENGEPFDLHFGPQKSPIFLLNEPGSRAALFFASSSDAAILLEMQKRHRNKVKDRKADENRLKGEIAGLDAGLSALEALDTLTVSVAEVDRAYQVLKQLEAEIQTLRDGIESIRDRAMKHEHLTQRCQSLAPLACPPELADGPFLESLIADLVAGERRARREEDHCNVLQFLNAPPVLDDAEELASLRNALSEEARRCRQFEARAGCLRALSPPTVMDHTAFFEEMIAELQSAEHVTERFRGRERLLQGLTPPPLLADPKPLAQLFSQLEGTLRAVQGHERIVADAAVHMPPIEAKIRAAEPVNSSPPSSGPSGSRVRGRLFLGAGGLVGLAAVVLLFSLALAWIRGRNAGAPDRPDDRIGPNIFAVAKVDDVAGARTQSESAPALEKSSPHDHANGAAKEPATNEDIKEEPPEEISREHQRKTEASEGRSKENAKSGERKPPASERATKAAKQLRLKELRRLLDDAEAASATGKHLDALLGFGQAAILFPQELAEVEDPAKVRLKFIDALKHYHAQVEQSLQKAAEHQTTTK